MKHLSLLLFTSLSLSWAQDLSLKKNNKTVTIKQNQPVVIFTQNSKVFNGRFQKMENNSIILEGNTIAIDQVVEIKVNRSRLYISLIGFLRGGLACGGLTAAYIVGLGALSPKYHLDGEAMLALIVLTPSTAAIGGTINAIRHAFKPNEISYKIGLDNWEIVAR